MALADGLALAVAVAGLGVAARRGEGRAARVADGRAHLLRHPRIRARGEILRRMRLRPGVERGEFARRSRRPSKRSRRRPGRRSATAVSSLGVLLVDSPKVVCRASTIGPWFKTGSSLRPCAHSVFPAWPWRRDGLSLAAISPFASRCCHGATARTPGIVSGVFGCVVTAWRTGRTGRRELSSPTKAHRPTMLRSASYRRRARRQAAVSIKSLRSKRSKSVAQTNLNRIGLQWRPCP